MNILDALKQLRDDIKLWVTNNLNALNEKIDEKTIPIDSELSSTSTNPVQNKAIKKAIDNVPKFSGSYNDLTDAPNIAEDDSGNMVIADESGNIIFKADADGIHTTAVSLNGEAAASQKYVDEAVANIDIPDVNFTGYATEDFVTSAVDSAKEELSESIVSESDEWKVVDESGNIIFSVDADGAHTTALSLNGESVEDIIDERVASLVDSAPDTLNTLNELAEALGDDPNFATTVATEIGKKVDKVEGKGLSTNDFTDEYKTKLDGLENITFEESDPTVPAWAKEETKPTYTAEEVGALSKDIELFSGNYNDLEDGPHITEDMGGELFVCDPEGNIIFKADAEGVKANRIDADELIVNGRSIEDFAGTSGIFSGSYNDLTDLPTLNNFICNNLFTGTKDFSGYVDADWTYTLPQWQNNGETYHGCVVLQKSTAWEGLSQSVQITAEKDYTLSAWIKCDEGADILFYGEDTDRNGTRLTSLVGTDWKRISQDFRKYTDGPVSPRFENCVDGKNMYICGLKLEKGRIATDWTPAPEDGALPKTTVADAGKFLRVSVDGVWAAESIPNAEGVEF